MLLNFLDDFPLYLYTYMVNKVIRVIGDISL